MGQRVHLQLSEVVQNPNVEVTLRHVPIVESEDPIDGNKQLVAIVAAYGVEIMFDAELYEGKIFLETDFNQWSSSFGEKYKFVASLGCSFTVN